MATKRKYGALEGDGEEVEISNKKHTLDSDEEDSDDYEKEDLNDSDIEGEEEGVAKVQDDIKFTPFNMREELQEGHFDKDGHYHWNKDAEIQDNWLDNIDWMKVKNDKNYLNDDKNADSDDEGSRSADIFNAAKAYAELLDYMQPNETVRKTLQRLGKNRTKISTAERLRRKKQGIVDEAAEKITNFTALANEILTRTGNMDVYEASYASIKSKAANTASTSKGAAVSSTGGPGASDECDMYADDFADKEKERLEASKQENVAPENTEKADSNAIEWEFKWKQDDSKLEGPFTTEQMLKWSQEGYFKEGVYCRKVGETTNFYTTNRIDFDLYL